MEIPRLAQRSPTAGSPDGTAVKRSLATELGFAALLVGMLVAQLDTNVVVAALPVIATDLQAGSALAGVTAAYLLTVTVTTPLAGKLGDVLGRRTVFTLSVLVFAAGSLACASSPTMPLLVASRALQGVGGAGLIVTAMSTLGQLFDKAELVRRQIWLTGVMAVSALAGPPIGGFVASQLGWRYLFLINLPVCAFAAVIGLRGLPATVDRTSLRTFDAQGVLLIAAVATSIVLLGSFGELANSALMAGGLLLVAISSSIAFVARERRARDPIIPLDLLTSRGLGRSIQGTFLAGVALFGTFTFIPLAVIAGTGYDTSTVGGLLIALTGGQLAISITFSFLARKYSRMVVWGRLAFAIGVMGLGLLAIVPQLSSVSRPTVLAVAVGGLALSGAALGLSMQAYTLLGITMAPPGQFGAAMATLTFARQLGGSLGAAVFGWMLIGLPSGPEALTAILASAGAVMAIALFVAPRSADEPAD
jgi:MFS family permease